MPGLLELQRAFAASLHDGGAGVEAWVMGDGLPPAARVRVYRNNVRALLEQALERTYPVLQRRVGENYFRQLAHFFRQAHPSRAGDLHEACRPFPAFLRGHLAEGPYAWLAELAALEWAVADAGVAASSPVVSANALVALSPDVLVRARMRFVSSLRLVAASVPLLEVWRANRTGAPDDPVDLGREPRNVVVHRGADGVQLRAVAQDEFEFIEALAGGAALGDAVDRSALTLDRLPAVLHWLFADGAVTAIDTEENRP